MKKLISLIMALVMVFTMAPAVFAEESDGSVVLLDETAVINDAFLGFTYDAVAPGDGNVTITFDDTTDLVPEYLVVIDEDYYSSERINAGVKGYSYTYMVGAGDPIYIEICLLSGSEYVTGSIDFTLVYTPVSASTEVETISGTASFATESEAYDGKSIDYTVPSNGSVTLNLNPHDGIYLEYKFEKNGYAGWYYTFNGDPATQTTEVSRGDVISVFFSTMSNGETYAPGTVDYELIFTPSGDDGGEGGEVTDTVLELGENDVKIDCGETFSADYTFISEEDGMLSISLTSLFAKTSFDPTPLDFTDMIGDYLEYGAICIYVNDILYTEPVAVTAGDTVTVYVTQRRDFATESYGWDMVLNLSMGGENEGGENEGGELVDVVTGTAVVDERSELEEGVNFEYTVPSDGYIILTLTPEEGIVPEYCISYGSYYEWFNCFNDESFYSQRFDVSAGDIFNVNLYTQQGERWNFVYGSVDYEIAFYTNGEGGEGGSIVDLGDIAFSIASGESYSESYSFVPEQDGYLYIDFSELIVNSPMDGIMDVTEWVSDYLGGALYVYVNEESYIGDPIEVTAGVPVEIYLYQPPLYAEYGYAWDALINLSIGTSAGPEKVALGEAMFFIDEGQEFSDVYTFTPEQSGLLYIDFIELSSYSAGAGDEDHTEFADEMLGGQIYIYVNEESYIGDPISVTAGVPVEIYMTQAPLYANYGYSWYAAVSLSLGVEGGDETSEPVFLEDGENRLVVEEGLENTESVYYYVATQDGTLKIEALKVGYIEFGEYYEDILEYLPEYVTIYVDGNPLANVTSDSIEVVEGQEVQIVLEKVGGWFAEVGFYVDISLSYKSDVVYGDVNGDGKVNIADANLVRRYSAKLVAESEIDLTAADVNADGKVNIGDANLIRRYAAKLIDKFPAEE